MVYIILWGNIRYTAGDDTWSESIQMVHGGRAQSAQIWIDDEKW